MILRNACGEVWPRDELDESLFQLTRNSKELEARWKGTWDSRRHSSMTSRKTPAFSATTTVRGSRGVFCNDNCVSTSLPEPWHGWKQ